MRQSIRVIVYNEDDDFAPTIRSDVLSVEGAQIVAEVDERMLIEQAVQQFPAEILMMHLDPMPEQLLPLAAHIASSHPDLAVFVISETSDAQHILTALRAGIREFLTKPIERDLVVQAIRKVASSSTQNVEMGRLIPIMGTMGGAGASVMAVNLAVEISEMTHKKPVALVDLDFRYGQLATMLDVHADYTIADLCDTPEQLDTAMIDRAMVKHASGIHLLARPNHFGQADMISAADCASVLNALRQMYAYVIVDGPTRFDPGGLAVLDLGDTCLFLIQLVVTSIRSTHRMMNELKSNGYNLDRFRLVCNRYTAEAGHLQIPHVESTLDKKVDYRVPADWRTVSAAVNLGKPLAEHAPKSRVRTAIREIAESIAQPEEAATSESAGRTGLLGRLFQSVS